MTRAIRPHRSCGPQVLEVAEVELPASKAGEARVSHPPIGMNPTSGAPAACGATAFKPPVALGLPPEAHAH